MPRKYEISIDNGEMVRSPIAAGPLFFSLARVRLLKMICLHFALSDRSMIKKKKKN